MVLNYIVHPLPAFTGKALCGSGLETARNAYDQKLLLLNFYVKPYLEPFGSCENVAPHRVV